MDFFNYDIILINSSAGKDSQTMLKLIVEEADAQDFPREKLIVAHADLGDMEWEGTGDLAEVQASYYGLRFMKITRTLGDILQHAEEKGKWPGPKQRWCTSDHKRDQIGKIITALDREYRRYSFMRKPQIRILNCFGFRSQESIERSKRPVFQNNKRASTLSRTVDDWLPIHDWTEDEVWDSINSSDVPYHPAYDLGMPRLSCIFCIFAPRKALILAGKHNRDLLDRYVAVEEKIDHTFTEKMSLASIRDAVIAQEDTSDIGGAWAM